MLVLTAVAAIAGLTFALASLLVLANRKLYVEEDPRIDVVEELLPHANCGACGVPGCRQFAEALVRGDAPPAMCTVSSEEGRARIAAYTVLYDAGEVARAVLLCDLPDGRRTLSVSHDKDLARAMTQSEFCGSEVVLSAGGGVEIALTS